MISPAMAKATTQPGALDRLSVRRAADRERIASEVELIAHDLDATATRETFGGPREINLHVEAACGLCLGVWLNGESSQPGVFILAWHMTIDATAQLADEFGYAQGARVNPYHKQKCTAVADGVGELLAKVRAGLMMARDGTAFLKIEG